MTRAEIAVRRAQEEVSRPVLQKTDEGKNRIDEYIRGESGLSWSWLKGSFPYYDEDSKFNWCGAFAAFVYQDVSEPLRVEHFASTNRLDNWSDGNARSIPIEPQLVQPGDIILVGPSRSYTSPEGVRKKHGRHIAIVESVEPANLLVNTIEGNTIGETPEGRAKGVARDQRFFPNHSSVTGPDKWRIVAVVRPLETDYAVPLPKETALEKFGQFAGKLSRTKKMGIIGILSLLAGGGAWYLLRSKSKKKRKKRK